MGTAWRAPVLESSECRTPRQRDQRHQRGLGSAIPHPSSLLRPRRGGRSMSQNDGGPAFPLSTDANKEGRRGMSLRDYFAGQALMGVMGNAAISARYECVNENIIPPAFAKSAYE